MNRSSLTLAAAVLGATLLVGPAGAVDPPLMALPESSAWQIGRAFVAAYNRGDTESLTGFLGQHLSAGAIGQEAPASRVHELQQRRRETGPVEIVEVSGVPSAVVLNARGAVTGADVILLLSSDEPGRLVELRVVRDEAEGIALRGAR